MLMKKNLLLATGLTLCAMFGSAFSAQAQYPSIPEGSWFHVSQDLRSEPQVMEFTPKVDGDLIVTYASPDDNFGIVPDNDEDKFLFTVPEADYNYAVPGGYIGESEGWDPVYVPSLGGEAYLVYYKFENLKANVPVYLVLVYEIYASLLFEMDGELPEIDYEPRMDTEAGLTSISSLQVKWMNGNDAAPLEVIDSSLATVMGPDGNNIGITSANVNNDFFYVNFATQSAPGTYTLTIPQGTVMVGTRPNEEAILTYVIAKNIEPELIRPEKFTSFEALQVTFGGGIISTDDDFEYLDITLEGPYLFSDFDGIWGEPSIIDDGKILNIAFDQTVSYPGNYTLTIYNYLGSLLVDGVVPTDKQWTIEFTLEEPDEDENPGDSTGVAGVANDGKVSVYNLQGVKMLDNADAASVNSLPAGLYIINGKKVVIR